MTDEQQWKISKALAVHLFGYETHNMVYNYCGSWPGMGMVMEAMSELGYGSLQLHSWSRSDDAICWAARWLDCSAGAIATNAPEAVARATLKALGVDLDGTQEEATQ